MYGSLSETPYLALSVGADAAGSVERQSSCAGKSRGVDQRGDLALAVNASGLLVALKDLGKGRSVRGWRPDHHGRHRASILALGHGLRGVPTSDPSRGDDWFDDMMRDVPNSGNN